MGSLEIVPLVEVTRECWHTHTYRFRSSFDGGAGQFVMVWVPRRDEVPMALSYTGDLKGITVHAYGDATKAMESFRPGDLIGVRGPYGNRFRIDGERVLCVAGGTGMASIIAAIEEFDEAGVEVETVLGAKTADELIFVDRAERRGKVHIATDDGSKGFRGLVPALAKKVLQGGRFDRVATCGPEVMMKAVVDLAGSRGIACQASLERIMKCGFGICDACVMDDLLVCRDGAVFDSDALAASHDFGMWRRDESGRRVSL